MTKYLLLSVLLTAFTFVFSKDGETKWRAGIEAKKVFIENKGQFNGRNNFYGQILYATDLDAVQIFFTKNGLCYRLEKNERRKFTEEEEREMRSKMSHEEWEKKEHDQIRETDFVQLQWKNSNPEAVLEASEPTDFYYNYVHEGKGINRARAYGKLTYKNLYPGIDVDYVFHPKEGIKYSLILHAGADVSKVKMVYSDVRKISLDQEGQICIPTDFGNITDHAPLSFIQGQESHPIASSFVQNGNTVSFRLADYDHSQTLIIDPWTTTPNLPNANSAFYIRPDTAGNAYVYGGDSPFRLQKYNSAGVLQWTYSTPWSTANNWFGGMAVDRNGNSYITNGDGASMTKIDSSGLFVWSHSSANAPASAIEFWTVDFNCDQTELFVGGSRHVPFAFDFNGTVFKMNMTNGTISSFVTVVNPAISFLPGINEVRSMCFSPNGNLYFVTLDTLGSVTTTLAVNYARTSGYSFPYYLPYSNTGGGQGTNSIAATSQFLYTTDGGTLHKRDIATGAIVGTVAVTGGSANNNSGLALDSCGNVYVGSQARVVKYDENLTYITSANTPEPVYDVSISETGDVLACGHNFAVALNMNSCGPVKFGCYTVFVAAANSTNASCNQCNGVATATPQSGTAPYTYLWSTGETTQSINALCAGNYFVTITDATGQSDSASVNIIQTGGSGTTTITSDKNIMCAGDSAEICALGGFSAYLWNTGETTQCIHALLGGNYYVSATLPGGCQALSNPIAIQVYPQPPVSISVNGDTLVAYNSTSYQWYLNGNPIPNATTPVYVATQNGNYQVAVTDTNGCTAFSNAIPIAVGISEWSEDKELRVFPNPLQSGKWTLETTAGFAGGKLEVFDNTGRLVYKGDVKNRKTEIEFSAAAGVYVLRVSAKQKSASMKLMKM